MTPPCCDRAWAKATGRGPLFIHGGAWAVRNEEPYGADGPVSWVPKPTSAEWLSQIVEAATVLLYEVVLVKAGEPAETRMVTIYFPAGKINGGNERNGFRGTGPDLRRALCAALNGAPCERTTA